MLDFYILEQMKIDVAIAYFIRKIHLIDDLTIKILININVIVSKIIIIDDNKQIVIIDNCELTIKFHVISRDNRINKVVRALK